eukprot:gene10905-12710_t
MYQLRDKGLVNLDDPVTKHFPEFTVKNPYKTKRDITLRQLASHQSGLQREVPCDFDKLPTDACTERIILQNLAETYLILPVYTMAHYSNLGLALLGRTLEKVAKTKYETYVEEKILNPLGMKNSSYSMAAIMDRMAVGIQYLDNGTIVPAPVYSLGWGAPMGDLWSTGRDMARYAAFWLSNQNDILDTSTVKEALSTSISLVNDGVSAFGTPWEISYSTVNNVWVREKGGAIEGYRCQLGMVRELRLGVFISGLMYIHTPDLFMEKVLDILIPAYETVLRQQAPSQPDFLETHESLKDNTPAPVDVNVFVGTYVYTDSWNETSALRVSNTNGQLSCNFGDNVTYSMSQFSKDEPHIFRLSVVDPSSQTCQFITIAATTYELAYFKPSPKGTQCNSVTVMGQVLPLVSRDPNILTTIKSTIRK